MHWTAANGGIRTSTLAPGATAARVRTVSRTAVAIAARSGTGSDSSRSQHGHLRGTAIQRGLTVSCGRRQDGIGSNREFRHRR